MKITEKQQEKSKVYLAAVLVLRDKKDELVKQQAGTIMKIASLKAELEAVNKAMIKAVDVNASKALRTKKRDLQEALEDNLAVNLNILDTLTALNTDLAPLRMAAREEIDAFTDACSAEIEAIQAKARQDIMDIRDMIDAHLFQMADKTINNIISEGGWRNLDGGHMSEPVKHILSKDGPDPRAYLPELNQVAKPEGHPWAGVSKVFSTPG